MILAVLEKWLQETLGSVTTSESLTAFPEDFYASLFADGLPPSAFVIEQAPPGWVTLHYNSFHELTELVRRLSAECSALVISIMAESVTETYLLQVAERSNIIRTLYYSGESGEWIRQKGRPFPFESEPL